MVVTYESARIDWGDEKVVLGKREQARAEQPDKTWAERHPDRKKQCVDCGAGFVVTSGEQLFYAKKQLRDPQRCQGCRQIRKERPHYKRRAFSKSRTVPIATTWEQATAGVKVLSEESK